MASIKQQVATKMVETYNGWHAVCLDESSKQNGWVFYKHPDGHWVTERLALPVEIQNAKIKLDNMEVMLSTSTKG